MRKPGVSIQVSFLIVLAFSLPSCTPVTKSPKTAVRETNHVELVADTARKAQEQFSLGQFKKALDVYSNAYDKYHHTGLRRGYVRLGEQIRTLSDAAFARGDFSEAGCNYSILFESGITTRDFAHTLSFDDDYLSGQVKLCSKTLMEAGLMRYREEKLDEAISLWKKVLVFDIDNRDARSAIDRTSVQLQQLNTIK